MYIFDPFYLAGICITSICLISNSFLIYFASKLSIKENDIKLIIIIAVLEYLAPIIVLFDFMCYLIYKKRLIENQYGCTIYGFIILFTYQNEIMLSSLVAMERLAKIKNINLFNYIYYSIIIDLIFFIILLIICAATNSFTISSVKKSCLLNVTNSILASFTYHYCLLSCFIGIGLLTYSYYCIANEISEFKQIIRLGSESTIETSSSNRLQGLKKATIKVYLILFIYGTCMLGSLICLFCESTLKYKFGDSFMYASIFNSIAAFLFVLGMIFSTFLVLTLHSGIANEAKCLIKKISCK